MHLYDVDDPSSQPELLIQRADQLSLERAAEVDAALEQLAAAAATLRRPPRRLAPRLAAASREM